MTECERIIKNGILTKDYFKSETKCDFFVDEQRKKVWAIEIDLLLKFDSICKKHNLTYYLMFGSLLGAIRHHGFIPWDDDMDVAMPRKDYEKLLTLNDEFDNPYFLQTPYTDNGYFYAHAKLRNSNTAALDYPFLYQNFNLGIFIDILPIDNFDIATGREKFELIHKLTMDNSVYMRLTHPNLSERDRIRVSNYDGADPFETYERIQTLARESEFTQTKYVSLLVATTYGYERDVFLAEDFSYAKEWKCEGFNTYVPNGYDRVLKTIYGDYLSLPSKEQRGLWHSNLSFDTEKSYKDYLENRE
ncbi:MAG: phosphorylcholine transferase LicD [Ruminococcus sp.]